ncbi:MAG: hypothetical protein ACOVNR_01445 [Chitinophagaceae bacterium]
MRLIKLGIISVIVLFVVASFISILLPSKVIVSRAVDVNVPADTVWQQVNSLTAWKNWLEGMNDKSVKLYTADSGILGNTMVKLTVNPEKKQISSTWQSNNDGTIQNSSLQVIGIAKQPKCIVQWQFIQTTSWLPWQRFSSLMNDKIMGVMLETNLNRLKALVEKTPMPES